MGSVEDAERRMGADAKRRAAARSQGEAAIWAHAEEVHRLLTERGVPEYPLSTPQEDDSGDVAYRETRLTARLVCVGRHGGPPSFLRASSGRFYLTSVDESSPPNTTWNNRLFGHEKITEAHQLADAFGDDERSVHAMYSVLHHFRLT